MKRKQKSKKKKGRKLLKILIGIVVFVILAVGILFTAGYFYYGKLVKSYLTEFVEKQTKGIYTADIGYLYINILSGNLTVRDITLTPDTALYRARFQKDSLSPMLFKLKIKFFKVKNFDLMKVIKTRKIDISSIQVHTPEITVYRMYRQVKKDTVAQKAEKKFSIPLPKGFAAISIREIDLLRGKLDFYDFTGTPVVHHSFPSCSVTIRNVVVDSVHQGKRRLFNAEDIKVVLGGLSFPTKNRLNRIQVGEIGLSTANQSVYIRNFHMQPLVGRTEYAKKLGYQTDRLDIRIPLLRLSRLSFRELLENAGLQAGLLEIEGLVVDDYRDKRIPRKPGFHPPMPQDGIRKLKSYLKIDTVILRNGKATYSEQTGPEPGTLFFNGMNAVLTRLTNDSAELSRDPVTRLKGSAFLMGRGRLDLNADFHLADKQNSFSFSATVGPMDLREVNPMLTRLLPAEITSGRIRQISVPLVFCMDDVAKGHLIFTYSALKVKVTSKEQTTWNSIKTGVINFIANDFVVPDENPTSSGKLKTGVVYFVRDKEKGILNFIWKSVFSGLKSQLGFNSKEQKEIKKAEKKKKK